MDRNTRQAGGGDSDGGDTPKTVASEYRFTNSDGFTMGETTAVKTAGGAFFLTGVYTEDGGTITVSSSSAKWAYLYDNTGEKGIV
jgi:hypothetical protein